MKLIKLSNTFYFLPTLDLSWDRYDEGEFIYIDFNITWFIWSLNINLLSEPE